MNAQLKYAQSREDNRKFHRKDRRAQYLYITPDGEFLSLETAAVHHRVARKTVTNRCCGHVNYKGYWCKPKVGWGRYAHGDMLPDGTTLDINTYELPVAPVEEDTIFDLLQ